MSYFLIPSDDAIVKLCKPSDEAAFRSLLRLFRRRGGSVHGSSYLGFDRPPSELTFWMEGDPTYVREGQHDTAITAMRRGIAESLDLFHVDQMQLAEFL